jgi:Meiotically up-regulated gene 113
MSKLSNVYAWRCGSTDLFKIGKGDDPDVRRKGLQAGNPYPLVEVARIETSYPHAVETFLHNRLEPRRSRLSGAQEFFEITWEELEVELDIAREWAASVLPMREMVLLLSRQRSEDRTVSPSDEQVADYEALRRAKAALFCAKMEVERLENKLKIALGPAAVLDGLGVWPTIEKKGLNQGLFKKEQKPMFELYQRITYERRFKLL